MNASEKEIVFTSGATESDNLAILGVAQLYRETGGHVVTAATEHSAVLDSCRELERQGFAVTYLKPEKSGEVPPERVRDALTEKTILVSVMLGNNEIGTIQRIAEIGAVCREKGVVFHTDAVQGFGKIPFDVEAMHVDLASVSAHKIYGPKGVGALYVRGRHPRVRLRPIVFGGGHERGMRSGTLNVPGIVGLGKAAELGAAEMHEESRRLRRLRNRLRDRIVSRLEDVDLERRSAPRDRAGRLSLAGWTGAAVARQPESLLRRRGRGGASREHEGRGGLLGLGLHLGVPGAVPRPDGNRRAGRSRARVDPLRPRALDHRRGSRLRGRHGRPGRRAPAGEVAPGQSAIGGGSEM